MGIYNHRKQVANVLSDLQHDFRFYWTCSAWNLPRQAQMMWRLGPATMVRDDDILYENISASLRGPATTALSVHGWAGRKSVSTTASRGRGGGAHDFQQEYFGALPTNAMLWVSVCIDENLSLLFLMVRNVSKSQYEFHGYGTDSETEGFRWSVGWMSTFLIGLLGRRRHVRQGMRYEDASHANEEDL